MRNVQLALTATLFMLFTQSCTHHSEGMSRAEWQQHMRELSQVLTHLAPYAANPDRFQAPENQQMIERELKQFAQTAQALRKDKHALDGDPSLVFSAKEFAAETAETYRMFIKGHSAGAQNSLQRMTNYCISCHSRTDRYERDIRLAWNADLSAFKGVERARFYLATRQTDQALSEFQKAASEPTSPVDQIYALKTTAAMQLRMKKDLPAAKRTLLQAAKSKNTPQNLKILIPEWVRSIDSSRDTLKGTKISAPPELDLKDRLAMATEFYQRGTQKEAKLNGSGYIEFLLASTLLHEGLANPDRSKLYTESLYLAGLNAEHLGFINLWAFNEAYYEACILNQPHSAIAMKCYRGLRKSVLADLYEGETDERLPSNTRSKLIALKNLAQDDLKWDQPNDFQSEIYQRRIINLINSQSW